MDKQMSNENPDGRFEMKKSEVTFTSGDLDDAVKKLRDKGETEHFDEFGNLAFKVTHTGDAINIESVKPVLFYGPTHPMDEDPRTDLQKLKDVLDEVGAKYDIGGHLAVDASTLHLNGFLEFDKDGKLMK